MREFKPYESGMGKLPELTMYQQAPRAESDDRPVTFNWGLRAANGEPLAKGVGETYGGFRYMRTAWANARLTCITFGGDRVPESTPPINSDSVITDKDGKPVLRIRRGSS